MSQTKAGAKPAAFLTMTSVLKCPHGGTITPSTSNTKVKAEGQFVLRASDKFTIGGCNYRRGMQPNPCVSVRWDSHANHHKSADDWSLTRDSVGYCLDGSQGTQGTVVIGKTQQKGSGL
jgi:hypothetical protein